MSTPAGWYPQPDGQQRYWDGQQWTENFAPGNSPGVPEGASSETAPGAARKNWFLRHKVITAVGAVLLVAMFSNLANGGTKSDNIAPVADQVTTSATPATPEQVAADQAAADQAAADKAAADKAAADQAAADKAVADKAAADQAAADKAAAAKATADKAAADKAAAAAAAKAAANKLTTAQENAKRKAESYLEMMGFSRSGLIKQLTFEGFTENDAKRAIDSMNVNWNTEAEQKAKSYLEMMGFSRSGLIKQLTFEGFTKTQAAHGADSVGL